MCGTDQQSNAELAAPIFNHRLASVMFHYSWNFSVSLSRHFSVSLTRHFSVSLTRHFSVSLTRHFSVSLSRHFSVSLSRHGGKTNMFYEQQARCLRVVSADWCMRKNCMVNRVWSLDGYVFRSIIVVCWWRLEIRNRVLKGCLTLELGCIFQATSRVSTLELESMWRS